MSELSLTNVGVDFRLRSSGYIGLKQKFVQFSALSKINLDFSDGDRVAILGKNGAGKTTLLKVISGILPPTFGKVESVGQINTALTMNVGMLNQATCLENIKLSGLYRGLKGKPLNSFIEDVIEKSELSEFLYQPVSTLSKGMRSRLVITMAVVASSPILVFDEWIGAVDRQQLEGKSALDFAISNSDIFIVATHKLGLVKKYCNRCVVLDRGKVIEDLDMIEGLKWYEDFMSNSDPTELLFDQH